MDLKHVAWALAALTLVAVIFAGGWVLFAHESVAPSALPGGNASGTDSPSSAAEERVLQGFNVAFWGDGRPFIRIKPRFDDEEATIGLYQYLVFEPQYAESGYSSEGGYTMNKPDPVAVENTYRLGLCCEHGLFGSPLDKGEALRWFYVAGAAGHAEAKAASARLKAAGVK